MGQAYFKSNLMNTEIKNFISRVKLLPLETLFLAKIIIDSKERKACISNLLTLKSITINPVERNCILKDIETLKSIKNITAATKVQFLSNAIAIYISQSNVEFSEQCLEKIFFKLLKENKEAALFKATSAIAFLNITKQYVADSEVMSSILKESENIKNDISRIKRL